VTTPGAVAALAATGPLGAEGLDALRGKPVAEVAREFEAMLLAQMIGAMRRTVGESGLLPASPERKVLDGFFDMELARALVDDLDLGLARQLTAEVDDAAGAHPTPAGADEPLVAPVAARVTSGFGHRADPLTGAPDFHAGVDLAAPLGTAVRAAAAGEVVFGGARGAAGNVVEIRHADGTRTSYAHLASVRVRAGARVEAGQVVGAVGASGRTTGPHLHFAVERAGRPVDPAPLLRGART